MLIGGYAVILNGVNRTTDDLDIFIERSEENASKILEVINAFGLGSIGFKMDDFLDENSVVQMGRVPHRIDILNTIPGVSFYEAFENSVIYKEEGIEIRCIHINQLINNKLAVARDKDLMDAKALKKILNKKK